MGNFIDAVEAAFETFKTFDPDAKPDIIKLGIPAVDSTIGGVLPGTAGIIGANNGVGKSSLVLAACLRNRIPSGYIGLEDPLPELGARVLSTFSMIPTDKIRNNRLNDEERALCRELIPEIKKALPHQETIVGGDMDNVESAVKRCVDSGCRIVWLDYLHKIKGTGGGDRTQEVSRAYTRFQRICAENGVACMVVCQFSRKADEVPQISWLKDTGDLENEARLILLSHLHPEIDGLVCSRIAKWSYGSGVGTEFFYQRTEQGTLIPTDSPIPEQKTMEF